MKKRIRDVIYVPPDSECFFESLVKGISVRVAFRKLKPGQVGVIEESQRTITIRVKKARRWDDGGGDPVKATVR